MDPRNKDDVKLGMPVRASIGKNDSREKWILTRVIEILSTEKYNPDGIEIIIHDNRSAYCKEFVNVSVEISESELGQLIETHETLSFELKASFQWSTRNNRKAECLGEQVVKEIVAFMNGSGGRICIGVDNSKNILGLKNDFSISPQKHGQPKTDAFISKIRTFVNDRLQVPTAETLFNSYVIRFQDKDVCIIDVGKSDIPIFVQEKYDSKTCDTDSDLKIKRWPFYVRTDQGTREYSPYEAKKYWTRERDTPFL